MTKMSNNLNALKDPDIFSLILFILYKFKDISEYSTISELAYVLDKKNLLNLCEYFGGLTITIPTVEEFEEIVYSLLLYEYVNIEGLEYNEALDKIGVTALATRNIKPAYQKVCEVLENYSFDNV